MFNPIELVRGRPFRPEGDRKNHENVARQLAALCLQEELRLVERAKPSGIYAQIYNQRHLNHYTHLLMKRAIHTRPDDPAVLDWRVTDSVDNDATLMMARRIVEEPLNQDSHS